ncbi:ExeM/NucH family extracellular endonuclease [Demequina sp. NBRC 110054]|uniref:ExeM/NucH family extracellular endonuclease n=1 Tax=Demequina sp. NBRC 110054 TaxID=1570343 RepID=UPI001F2E5DEA|nr:ExeM/NucH family extracellular endonuclease [Demequina sp. NBRC 110054]
MIAVPTAQAATGDDVLINEVLISTTGADREYIELYGTPGTSLEGLSIIEVEGDSASAVGEIDHIVTLPAGAELGGNGYYLIANTSAETEYGVTADLALADNFFENGTLTIALVDSEGLGGKGVGDTTDGITTLDSLASVDTGADDVTYLGAPVLGPDGSYAGAGWGRIEAGVDTDTADDWELLDFNLASPPNTPTPAGDAPQALVINEVLISTTSNDREYVELYGTPGTSLEGLSIIEVEGDSGSTQGQIDHIVTIPAGAEIGDNGYYLIANSLAESEYSVTADLALADNFFENGTLTIALVDSEGLAGKGVGDTTDGVTTLDSLASIDTGASDLTYLGAPVLGPDGSYSAAGWGRTEAGVDTDTVEDWTMLDFNLASPPNTPTASTSSGDGDGSGEAETVFLHDVQGTGGDSPLVGQTVTVEAVVVGDYEGASPELGGFFLQEEDADADADDSTSEGVFVYNGSSDSVSLGDHVKVTGTVSEYYSNTQINATSIEVIETGVALPTAATIEFPVSSLDDLEAYEGMVGTLPQELVVSEYYNYDQYGEVVVALPSIEGVDRVMNPTAVFAPDSAEAAALSDLNERSRITIDDGNTSSNPDVSIHPITRELFTLDNAFRGGDTVTGLTGPIFYSYSLYRILPYGDGDGYDTYTQTTAPSEPEDVGGDLTVASFNALNYFVSLDTADTCGPTEDQDCRGADDREEFERQHAKLMNALVGLDADVVGLVEIENTTGVEALATIVDGEDGAYGDGSGLGGLNDILGEGTYDYIVAGTDGVVGTDAIKTGIIYRTDAVTPLGASAVLDSEDFLDPLGVGSSKNRAAVAQSFTENSSGEVFSVAVNHLKSKGSACGETGEGGLEGNCNDTRTAAAEVLAEWIEGDPTGSGDSDWLILGDLNSYDKEDPIVALESAGYTDQIGAYQGEYAYSYVYDGEVGYLDYVMSSETLSSQVTGATEWHINSDEPDIVDYDTSYKSDAQAALFDDTTPYRASDHDAALIGLSLSGRTGGYTAPETTLDVTAEYTDTNGDGVPSIGDMVTFTGTVTNEGDYSLEGIALAETSDSDISGVFPTETTLAAGSTLTWTVDHVLLPKDFARGSVTYGATLDADGLDQLTDSDTIGDVEFAAFAADLIAALKNAIVVCVDGEVVTSLEPGQEFSVHVKKCTGKTLGKGTKVFIFSTPTELGSGSGTLTVPTTLATGSHRVAVYGADGELMGWVPVTVAASDEAAAGEEADDDSTTEASDEAAAGDSLASTGIGSLSWALALAATLAMLIGGLSVARARLR